MAARRPAVLMLMGTSAMALATAMALALIYAVGQYLGAALLDIPAMLPTHGLLQAAGFALCGLLAWHADAVSDAGTGDEAGERGASAP